MDVVDDLMDHIQFLTSQVPGEDVVAYNHADSPWHRLWSDITSFFGNILYLPNIISPLKPLKPGLYAELNLKDPLNLYDMFLHFILVIIQLAFLLGFLPFLLIAPVPGWVGIAAILGFLLANKIFCLLLNGFDLIYYSDARLTKPEPAHEKEQWIFLNGVAVGRHWLKNNINRLALTFGRPVIGIHNKTSGIVFDVIQCLIQRNMDYNTPDIRNCYGVLKSRLYNPKYEKIVFIMHSQGAIEGSMIVDWLLQEVPQDLLLKLELYTFGAAANHFNNPYTNRAAQAQASLTAEKKGSTPATGKALRYVEHYANETDFVARWGVLNFTKGRAKYVTPVAEQEEPTTAAFMGRVFERPGVGGHQFNQHYLDYMFPLYVPAATKEDRFPLPRCKEENAFMEMHIAHGGKNVVEDDPIETNGTDAEDSIAPTSSNIVNKLSSWRESLAFTLAGKKAKHTKGNHPTKHRHPSQGRLLRESVPQSLAGTTRGASSHSTVQVEILDGASPISRLPADMGNGDSIDRALGHVSGTNGTNGVNGFIKEKHLKVKHFSRLWMYRNGRSPGDDDYLENLAILKRETI